MKSYKHWYKMRLVCLMGADNLVFRDFEILKDWVVKLSCIVSISLLLNNENTVEDVRKILQRRSKSCTSFMQLFSFFCSTFIISVIQNLQLTYYIILNIYSTRTGIIEWQISIFTKGGPSLHRNFVVDKARYMEDSIWNIHVQNFGIQLPRFPARTTAT